MTDRRGILLLAFIGLATCALIVGLQPYSVRSPWQRWDEPGRRYFEAAARLDTAALQRLTASPNAVEWALRTGRLESPARREAFTSAP